ncbi:ABC-2 type transporter, partial [Leptospira interrogans serovar Copenhageni str. LT2050]
TEHRPEFPLFLQDLKKAKIDFKDFKYYSKFFGRNIRSVGIKMNLYAIKSIYIFEMSRTWRTLFQSIASPVISTSLYFVVFGSAIGSRIQEVDGVGYGSFIVPGLIMLSLLTESISNSSFGIYFPKFTGTIYEILAAPISMIEIVIGFVGAAATKSVILGTIMLATASLFVPIKIAHPFVMILFLLLTSISFSLFGFIIGIWADSFEKLQVIPLLIITPLVFLGGSFYSANMLPPFWQKVTFFNPVLYLVSGFRWSFYEISDVSVGVSLTMVFVFLSICLCLVWMIFKTGYKIKK